MNRYAATGAIAIALAAYGVYYAFHIPPLLVGAIAPLLLIGFAAQAVAALVAAVGVWRGAAWAPAAAIALGAAVVFTELVEAFVLDIVAYGHAIVVSVVALLIAIAIAVYMNRSRAIA